MMRGFLFQKEYFQKIFVNWYGKRNWEMERDEEDEKYGEDGDRWINMERNGEKWRETENEWNRDIKREKGRREGLKIVRKRTIIKEKAENGWEIIFVQRKSVFSKDSR